MKCIVLALGLGAFIIPVTAGPDHKTSSAKPDCETQLQTSTDVKHMRFKELLGSPVNTRDAASLGEMQDIVFDATTGQISFAIVGKHDGIGVVNTITPIPWRAVDVQTDKQYIVNVDRQKLGSMPKLPETNASELAEPDYMLRIYRFYGIDEPMQDVGAPGFDTDTEAASGSSEDDE